MSAHNFVDLTGQKFDMLTVTGFNKKTGKWTCICDCENHTVVEKRAGHLHMKNRFQSCGCCNNVKFIDISNQRFGSLTALEYDKNKSAWKCKCDCGSIVYKKSGHLREGSVTRCGNNCALNNNLINIKGQRFGKLVAENYIGNNYWECKCDCGNKHDVLGTNLRNGSTTSCGKCIGSTFVDIKGRKFGKLTALRYLGKGTWECLCDCGNICYKNSYDLRERGVKSCGCDCGGSDKENTIFEYISSIYTGRIIRHDREVLKGKELDLYIPDKKIAIEFNGNYWHSIKDKTYHQQKTIACARKGIHLIHIFEYEWDNEDKQRKIKDYISSLISVTDRIYARMTNVRLIDNTEASCFLNKYHLQNYVASSISIGCYYNSILVGVMTFGIPRFNKNYDYELLRLCWLPTITVVGGTNKLFSYFLKNYNPASIICYSDISKFTGNIYLKLGFKVIVDNPISRPNYVWISHHGNDIKTRYQTQKHRLLKNNLGTNEMTEDSIMSSLEYYKVYDCGNLRLEWRKK